MQETNELQHIEDQVKLVLSNALSARQVEVVRGIERQFIEKNPYATPAQIRQNSITTITESKQADVYNIFGIKY